MLVISKPSALASSVNACQRIANLPVFHTTFVPIGFNLFVSLSLCALDAAWNDRTEDSGAYMMTASLLSAARPSTMKLSSHFLTFQRLLSKDFACPLKVRELYLSYVGSRPAQYVYWRSIRTSKICSYYSYCFSIQLDSCLITFHWPLSMYLCFRRLHFLAHSVFVVLLTMSVT